MTRADLIRNLIHAEALVRRARTDIEFAATEPFLTSAHESMQSAKRLLDGALSNIYTLDKEIPK